VSIWTQIREAKAHNVELRNLTIYLFMLIKLKMACSTHVEDENTENNFSLSI
jgi:hypothetical protein